MSHDVQDIIDDKLVSAGKLFLFGEITEELAQDLLKKMKYLDLLNYQRIYLYIHSCGGDVEAAMLLLDEIDSWQKRKKDVVLVVCGKAHSAAAIILAYGSERYATKNSNIMLHPVMYGLPDDYHEIQKKYSDFVATFYDKMIDDLARKCGYTTKKSRQQFKDEIKDGLWLFADEAIDYGILDGIWTHSMERDTNTCQK